MVYTSCTLAYETLVTDWQQYFVVLKAAGDKTNGDGGGSSGGVRCGGLWLHNAVLKGGRLVVQLDSAVSMSAVTLQLTDSTKRRSMSTAHAHRFYRCPVRMRDVVTEITLPCDDSVACCRGNVYLSCSELQ